MKNDIKKVSIIIPTYESEKYIVKAVNSILNQSYKNIELIVVDDGSNDGTKEVLSRISDERLKYYYQENSGVSKARNRGLEHCTGELIMFSDSDDYYDLNMVEEMVKAIERNSADLSVCGFKYEYIDDNYSIDKSLNNDTEFVGKKEVAKAFAFIENKGLFASTCNKLYKAKIIKENKIYFNEDFHNMEDFLFNCAYIEVCNSVKLVNKSFYHYTTRNEESLSCKYKPNLIEDFKSFTEKRKQIAEKLDARVELEGHINLMHITSMVEAIPNLFRKNNNLNNKERKKLLYNILGDNIIKENLNYVELNSTYDKLFRKIYSLKNKGVIFLTYKTLFFLRNNFEGIYIGFRKKHKN